MPLVLAVTAVTSGTLAVAAAPDAQAPAAERTTRLETPVLSPRRVPELLAATVARTRLTAALDAAIGDPSLGGAARSSCLAVEDAGTTLYAQRADAPLAPASTMKLLTATAALRRLGPDFRFVTEVRAGGPPADGVVDGPLWFVGSGDPIIQTGDYTAALKDDPPISTPLEVLADAVVAAGIREIKGPVAGDESRYDNVRYVPAWKAGYIADNEVGPVSALTVNDNLAQYPPKRTIPATDPATNAAAALTFLLRVRGVLVDGDPTAGPAPPGAVAVASVTSPPLTDVVGEMLEHSDNQTAETLVKELGARFGRSGSWDEGLAVVRAAVADAGVPVDAYAAVDGSGLDGSDRLTCAQLLDVLDAAGASGPLAAGLPVAGRSGTLAKRLLGTTAAGRVRAKTGTLDHVASLAGFVDRPGTTPLEFALIANDLPDRTATGRVLQDRVALALAAYPDTPTPDAIAPEPPGG